MPLAPGKLVRIPRHFHTDVKALHLMPANRSAAEKLQRHPEASASATAPLHVDDQGLFLPAWIPSLDAAAAAEAMPIVRIHLGHGRSAYFFLLPRTQPRAFAREVLAEQLRFHGPAFSLPKALDAPGSLLMLPAALDADVVAPVIEVLGDSLRVALASAALMVRREEVQEV